VLDFLTKLLTLFLSVSYSLVINKEIIAKLVVQPWNPWGAYSIPQDSLAGEGLLRLKIQEWARKACFPMQLSDDPQILAEKLLFSFSIWL